MKIRIINIVRKARDENLKHFRKIICENKIRPLFKNPRKRLSWTT